MTRFFKSFAKVKRLFGFFKKFNWIVIGREEVRREDLFPRKIKLIFGLSTASGNYYLGAEFLTMYHPHARKTCAYPTAFRKRMEQNRQTTKYQINFPNTFSNSANAAIKK